MNRKHLLAGLVLATGFAAAPAFAHGDYCAKPFQYAGTVVLKAGYAGNVGEFAIPKDMRLQIEYVSAGLRMSTNDGRGAFAIGTIAGGTFGWHPLPIETGYALSDRQTSDEVKLYADPGSLVKIEFNRASGTNVDAVGRYTVTGCLFKA